MVVCNFHFNCATNKTCYIYRFSKNLGFQNIDEQCYVLNNLATPSNEFIHFLNILANEDKEFIKPSVIEYVEYSTTALNQYLKYNITTFYKLEFVGNRHMSGNSFDAYFDLKIEKIHNSKNDITMTLS